MKDAPLEFLFQDELTNKTIILEGHFEPIDIPERSAPENITSGPIPNRSFNNSTGPMLYVLAVILVYGLSMFLIVGTLARKKSYHKQLDVEVGRYIKGLETARQEAKQEQVKLTRLRWPGNFIAFNNPDSDLSSSDSDQLAQTLPAADYYLTHPHNHPDINSDQEGSQESSYMELPATTVTPGVHNNHKSGSCSSSSENSLVCDHPAMVGNLKPDMINSERRPSKVVHFLGVESEVADSVVSSTFSLREATALSVENLNVKPTTTTNTQLPIIRINSASQQDITSYANSDIANDTSAVRIRSNSAHERPKFYLPTSDTYRVPPVHTRTESPDIYNKTQISNNNSIDPNKLHIHPNRLDMYPSRFDLDPDRDSNTDDQILTPYNKRRKMSIINIIKNRTGQNLGTSGSITKLAHGSNASGSTKTLTLGSERKYKLTHRGSSPRSGDSGGDSEDEHILEQYRKSTTYRMRSRRRLAVDQDMRVSTSSEGSPFLPIRQNRIPVAILNNSSTNPTHSLTQPNKQRHKKHSQVSHTGTLCSDASDADDFMLEQYKHSTSYQSRTRGRRAAIT